jgi:hypothetical protein
VRITPFAVLEAHAREEYRKRFASAPEPRVINARVAATLDAPRSFVWGGIGYWAPPLSYEGGLRLLIAAHALADLRRKGASALPLHAAALKAARIIRQSIRPVRRWRRPWWPLSRAFYRSPAEELEALCRWLIHVPDDSPVVPSDRRVTVDLLDQRYAFELAYGREPRSWADYVLGSRAVGRRDSRTDLRLAVSVRVGTNADKKGWGDYEREMRQMAGWN